MELNYEDMLLLDAEDLAEGGIQKAYDRLGPKLRDLIGTPEPVEDILDWEKPSYHVRFRGEEYCVYAEGDDADAWGRATYVLFHIVNQQLAGQSVRLYALYGGNDLGGMFLTPAEAEAARGALESRSEWPYLPEPTAPWFGCPH